MSLASAQIPEGFELLEITAAFERLSPPRINNCGQAVFSRGLYSADTTEVFLYDNGILTQITENYVSDAAPDISATGTMVWMVGYDGSNAKDILIFEAGELRAIGPGTFPRINNLGHIVFTRIHRKGCRNVDGDIYFYDGDTVRRISDGFLSNQSPEVNDRDEIVWTRYNFCENPWVSDIMFYSDGNTRQVTARQIEPQEPGINDVSQLVWGGPGGIEVWENGVTRLITNWGRNGTLNNHGDVFFLRWHDDNQTWQTWLYLNTGQFLQLTDDPFWNMDGEISDSREIVWRSLDLNSGRYGVLLLRRIRTGEADFDGDVDLIDYAQFAACLTGPEWVERTHPGPQESLCDCRFLDIDHDGDVDLPDFALFQNAFTGE